MALTSDPEYAPVPFSEYRTIRERLGPFDLVMLEVGAFHPAWGDIHLGPENASKALQLLGGGAFLPAHWGTFSLAMRGRRRAVVARRRHERAGTGARYACGDHVAEGDPLADRLDSSGSEEGQ